MIAAVIPARLASTRLPNKMLLDLNGKSVLQRTYDQVCQMKKADAIYIATDSEQIQEAALGWGAQVKMTSPDCPSGTFRIASLLDEIEADFFLNVQGDEPFIQPKLLDDLVNTWETTQADIVTTVTKITTLKEIQDPNLVKVVLNLAGRAIYFSRSPIPFVRDFPENEWLAQNDFWAHIGVYGYTRETLSQYPKLEPSNLENIEKLEQLRFLDHGFSIQTMKTDYRPIGIDTKNDLEAAREHLNK